ncbi:molybdopterin-dependent oxidoreductase [Pseudomonas sp. JUb96]|uniref:SorA family sulfite dehydrogenase catalytic subunit n=1 Tax=Pseudomonas sp. JUb96 TaxID=2940539 RepID=UPI002227DC0E|nr:molybdopterin-dependent oxidoreductase [Pseudomonas sp. JUb96]MCW2269598.1 DMSO/TMAO reductase YedYZ molybdopterin-dependent catalytic subunit [Pseudomonas sp. JUb96]
MKFSFIDNTKPSRRRVLRDAITLALAASPLASLVNAAGKAGSAAPSTEEVTFAAGPRPLVQYPQKRPLTLVTTRPPHLETPFGVFSEGPITPNDAFFVRYHLANFPTSIDPDTYRLTIKGSVETPLSLSLAELKSLAEPVEVIAVNQCSGNSRGFSMPRVFGAQLGNGSMGNARWLGVPLKAVLEKAGVKAGARQVTFRGLDKPVLASTPEFIKALDISHVLGGEPMIAWSMNGTDLPFLNGYPIRLVVPGYFGTYWVKHLSEIEVVDHTYDGFFMAKGYRVPDNDCLCIAPGTTAAQTKPISKMPVRSFITSVKQGDVLPLNTSVVLKGIAFDGGDGINKVQLSVDGGESWREAQLGQDLGRFSFREWTLPVTFPHKGATQLMVRATNRAGEVQPLRADWNPGGYRRHVVETSYVTVA